MNAGDNQIMRQRTRKDNLVRYVVTTFGALVLLTLVVLISHLLIQAVPLALKPALTNQQTLSLADVSADVQILTLADTLEGQPLAVRTAACALSLVEMDEKRALSRRYEYKRPCQHEMTAVSSLGRNYLVDVSARGLVRIDAVRDLTMTQSTDIATGAYEKTLGAAPGGSGSLSFSVPEAEWARRTDWSVMLSQHWAVFRIATSDKLLLRWVNRDKPVQVIDQHFDADANAIALPGVEQTAVYRDQQLRFYAVKSNKQYTRPVPEGVAWWQSLEKDRSLFVADESGRVTRWVLQNQREGLQFTPTYSLQLASQEKPRVVRAHPSSNALVMLTSQSRIMLLNRVSGEVVTQSDGPAELTDIAWFGNRLYAAGVNQVSSWTVKYLSGITTWSSLFQPQQYEGYAAPQTIWQTTNASDYLEAKYSLTPLLIGSIKASLLALLVAIPVAVSAAVFTAFFAGNRLRHLLKPAIELLEAVPSVLIGFIAAIWLSPVAEQFLFSFVFVIVTMPVLLLIAALLHNKLTLPLPVPLRQPFRIVSSMLTVVLLGYLSVKWSPWLTQWIFDVSHVGALDNNSVSPVGKTTLIVAIALGVAISPSIYSLAEDAISGVPDSLKNASYALGATRLQTLRYVVLHVAMPGILAAIMLGFGRAFGETMIVLMVTGNTPVASWSLFDGLRALTANLAIELPEADASGTHYHILFFTACILFAFTFVVNTLAEFLRRRLRRNAYYG